MKGRNEKKKTQTLYNNKYDTTVINKISRKIMNNNRRRKDTKMANFTDVENQQILLLIYSKTLISISLPRLKILQERY